MYAICDCFRSVHPVVDDNDIEALAAARARREA